ncbi:DNA polymerase III subunit delta [Paraphotobacterium marinum]|uniref:DNA polymerase III subunit delta n=2 Tax=Paraphotobacterium marinum TaxID=1755811 RepID=A0A220VCT1_9GAMM|nr:DNA polymerase III subunit delta [Paraphotobacterium marinum]ASK77783.1 DNA polymerase III subunit delta [Paraphotobacterium marinum]
MKNVTTKKTNISLLIGDDSFIVSYYKDKIISQNLLNSNKELNRVNINCENDYFNFESLANEISLFKKARILVATIHNFNLLQKLSKYFLSLIEGISSNDCFIIILNQKLTKQIERNEVIRQIKAKYELISCNNFSEFEIRNWITKECLLHDISIEEEAISKLLEFYPNSFHEIHQSIEKLKILKKSYSMFTKYDIEHHFEVNDECSVFNLSNAWLKKDLLAFNILRKLRLANFDTLFILNVLLKDIFYLYELIEISNNRSKKDLFFKRNNIWSFKQNQLVFASKQFSVEQLQQSLKILLQAEKK